MDRQPTLTDGKMTLRPLAATDRAGLFAAASDPITWAGHPASDRYKPEVFNPYFDSLLDCGETLVVILEHTIIGCSRYYTPHEDPSGIAIGYTFIAHTHWGGSVNRQMKSLMLTHAFAHHDPIWFHIAPDNIRSQKATGKFGAILQADGEMMVGGTTGEWKSYTLTKSDWRKNQPV